MHQILFKPPSEPFFNAAVTSGAELAVGETLVCPKPQEKSEHLENLLDEMNGRKGSLYAKIDFDLTTAGFKRFQSCLHLR